MESPADSQLTLYRAGTAEPLKPSEKKELLGSLRAGEHVELEFEAIPFIQRPTPNRNFVRFPPGKLPGFAKSYEGAPFLKNHDSWDVSSRGGTILSSKLEHNEDGSKQMRMRVKAVKPWAVEGLLDETIDRFSIGWDRGVEELQCSIHEASWYSCSCRLGTTLEDGRIVETMIPNPTGTEMSGVNVPAVVGTHIESISQLGIDSSRLADSLVRDAKASAHPERQVMDPAKLAALCAVLGLSATSTPDEIIRSAEKLAADRDDAIEDRDTLRTQADVDRKTAELKLAKERKGIVKTKLDALKSAGKIKPGSKREERLLARAEKDFEDFVESCDELLADGERVTPAGAPALAVVADTQAAAHPTETKTFLSADATTASWLKSAGISEAEFEKHGSYPREYITATRNAR